MKITAPPEYHNLIVELAYAIRTGHMAELENHLRLAGLGVVLRHRNAGTEPPLVAIEAAKDRARCLVQFMGAHQ